jgi:tRNA (guanosine-2'-O-)-methyltransferase
MKKRLTEHLKQFVTERRLKQFEKVLDNRTRFITVVLEDIFQPHNASAVLRTCECFGIQDIHIIENKNTYEINPDVALGSYKWLSLHKYNTDQDNTKKALESLKAKGYTLVAAIPGSKAVPLEEFDVSTGKTALLFGTELNGLSETAVNMADIFVKIPMVGFTQSFNISVAAAIIIHQLVSRLHKSDAPWHLGEDEKSDLMMRWLKNSIKKSDVIEKLWLDNQDIDES